MTRDQMIETIARALEPDAWWNADGPLADMADVIRRPSISAATAALTALEAAGMRVEAGWQPIETAPRDALLLGHADGMMRLVMWEDGAWVQVGATIQEGWFEPTHWMPLPTPPAQEDSTSE